jgi:hypothetical protein
MAGALGQTRGRREFLAVYMATSLPCSQANGKAGTRMKRPPIRRNLPAPVQRAVNKLDQTATGRGLLSALAQLKLLAARHKLELILEPDPPALPCIIRILRNGLRLRLRRVVRRSASLCTYRWRSNKTHQSIECEGNNELNEALHLECDLDVSSFWEQSVLLLFAFEGRVALYRPDFEVWRGGQLTLLEVKPDPSHRSKRRARTPPPIGDELTAKRLAGKRKEKRLKDQRRILCAAEAFHQLGMQLVVLTADVIEQEPRFGNVKTLFEYRASEPSEQAMDRIRAEVARQPRATLGDLASGRPVARRHAVLAMIARGHLLVDLDVPIEIAPLTLP